MTRIIRTGTLAFAVVVLHSSLAFAQTLEEVQKKLQELMSSHKTLAYKNHIVSEMDVSGVNMKSESDQSVEVARQGDTLLSRVESTTAVVQKSGDHENKMTSKVVSVTDGQYGYTYSEVGEMKSAVRQKLDRSKELSPFDILKGFKEREKTFSLKLKPEETVDGKKCYVIEMTAKDPTAQPDAAKVVLRFDKATGIGTTSTAYNKDGKIRMQTTTTDVKVNQAIPADRFKFKAPAGVTVQDMPPQNP